MEIERDTGSRHAPQREGLVDTFFHRKELITNSKGFGNVEEVKKSFGNSISMILMSKESLRAKTWRSAEELVKEKNQN